MTHSPLRLVVGPSEGAMSHAIELPVGEAAPLHLHLHFGVPEVRTVSGPSDVPLRRSRLWLRRLAYLGTAAVLVLVSYDVGTFAPRRAEYRPVAVAGAPSSAIPGIPLALREQLAEPPVVTPPPSAPPPGTAFGLHP